MAGYSVTFSVVDEATAKINAINQRIRQMREPIERQARAVQQFINVSGLGKIAQGFTSIARTALDAFLSMSRLVPVLGTITGAATLAGMLQLVKTWGAWAVALRTDADRIGTSAQQLETLQDATRLAGGSVDDMTESLKGLTDTAANAYRGTDPAAVAWFNRAKINLRDMNGQLRSATDLLPDVLRYLDSRKNPADRKIVAEALGGPALYNLSEDFRRAQRAGESFDQTYQRVIAAAKQRPMISQDALDRAQRFTEATGKIEVAIGHLGTAIGSLASGPIADLEDALTGVADKIADLIAKFQRWASDPKNTGWLKQIAEWAWKISTLQFRVGAAEAKFAYNKLFGGETFGPPIPPELKPAAPAGKPAAPAPAAGQQGSVIPIPPRPGPGPAPAPARMSGDHAEFIRRVTPLALEASKRTGVDPRVIVAQAALESNWGKSAPGNNYFGIKGPGGTYATQEFEGGRFVTKEQSFAGYGSIEESFKGYADFINKNPRYRDLQSAHGLDAQIAALQRSGYATDPGYGAKIAAIASRLAAPQTVLAQAAPAPAIDLGQYRTGLAAPLAAPQATGAPAQVTGGPSVTGSVDVTITHKNPPPSDTLAAAATGDVNLAPPRTERQQLAAA